MRKLVFILFAIYSLSISAQKDGDDISFGKYKILHSEVLNEDRTLLIHLPKSYEKSTKYYPVLYMLYGNHTTTYFAEAVSILNQYGRDGQIPEMILVAITNTDRYRDLLPLDRNGNKTGIDNFQEFFKTELIGYVEKNYRTKNYRVLLGPQAGANFSLYTMLTEPELFNAYIINNPFRWSSGRELLMNGVEEYFNSNKSFKKFLFITHDKSDELEIIGNEYIEKFSKLIEEKKPQEFKLVLNYLPENNDFISPTGLREGIKTLFFKYLIPKNQRIENLSDITVYYNDLSQELGFEVDIPGHVLTTQSDNLASENKEKEAVEIYHYMIKTNSQVANAYWRLASISIRDEDYNSAKDYLGKMMEVIEGDIGMIKQRYDFVIKKLEEQKNK